MKKQAVFLMIAVFLLTSGMKGLNSVTLTAADVDGAEDIEFAIRQATADGTMPGRVVLDSSQGDFVFSTDDKTINIFVPNLTLISKNGAVIKNCEGAINFDALPASNVTIEGIRFLCSGDGISSSDYPNAGIRIVKNEIYVQGIGLDLGSLNNATIADNKITGKVGVRLDESSSALKVSHNQIDAVSIGIAVQGSDWNQVVENRIAAGWQGILLSGEADFNQVLANKISRVEQSGVALDGDPFGNQIFGNKVVCSIGAECKAVDAQMELIEQNHIKGNH